MQTDPLSIIFYLAILIISVVIHEVSHGFMARALGDPTAEMAGRLTLNPLKHLDPIGSFLLPLLLFLFKLPVIGWARPVPYNPYNLKAGRSGPALVAAAGPAANLLVAVMFGLGLRLLISGQWVTASSAGMTSLVVLINLLLMVFNLIPVPPLDGSKILFALIPYKWRAVENVLNQYQIIFLIGVIYFAGQLIWPLSAFLFRLLTGLTT